MLFDSHAHYDDKKFKNDMDQTLKSVYETGVRYILNAASDIPSLESTVEMAEKYPFVYAAVGIHPHNANDITDEILFKIKEYTKKTKVVAIGEIGLDYHYDFSPRDIQKKWLIKQIELAKELKMPVIIHDRESHEDILKIVKENNAGENGGVFHCFSGSVEMLKTVLDSNFHIGLGGPVTFSNARKTVEVAKSVPLDRLLIETDSPYLTPEPFRGKRNDSSYVRFVVEKIAEIRGMSFEELAEITTQNTKKLFGII